MFENFHFLRVEWLWLLGPFVGLILWRLKRTSNKHLRIKTLPTHLQSVLMVGEHGWSRHAPIVLLAIMGLLAIVIASGPSWKRQSSPISEDLAPLVVVLDVSKSMLEKDIAPNRLYRAKRKISELVAQRDGGLTALIAYSGSAHQAMPLTRDKAMLEPLLHAISPNIMPRQGKFEHYALPVIQKTLAGNVTPATILLVTDAVNRDHFADWQSYIESTQHKLIIWGVGNPEILTQQPLEESGLTQLAKSTDGKYVLFTPDDDDIKTIDKAIAYHLSANQDEAAPWLDSGYLLIWFIVPIYLLWGRKGWIVQWCLALTLTSSFFYSPASHAQNWSMVDWWLSQDQQAQYQFDQQNYSQAALLFEDYHWKAFAFYQAGNYQQAENYYRRRDDLPSMLGVGASLMHQKEYIAARNWYQNLLKAHPNQATAEHNLMLVESILEHIDAFGEGQSKSTERQTSRELGDKPQTSEGIEKLVQQEQIIQPQLTADDILNNPNLNEQWMKRVESHQALFLANKFYAQLAREEATATVQIDESDDENVNAEGEIK